MINLHHFFRGFKRSFIILTVLILAVGCGVRVPVVTNLAEFDANEVLAILLNSGLNAQKTMNKDGLSSISVDDKEVAVSLDLLRSRGLPRGKFQGLGVVFKREGMVSSPVEERARYLYALSEEISSTLSHIDGVIVARVHLVLPEHNAFTEMTIPSSAAVFIKYQRNYNLDILQTQMKKLVSNSIPGLSTDHVSIVLVPGEDYSKIATAQGRTLVDGHLKESSSSPMVIIMAGLGILSLLAGAVSLVMYIRSRR